MDGARREQHSDPAVVDERGVDRAVRGDGRGARAVARSRGATARVTPHPGPMAIVERIVHRPRRRRGKETPNAQLMVAAVVRVHVLVHRGTPWATAGGTDAGARPIRAMSSVAAGCEPPAWALRPASTTRPGAWAGRDYV